MKVNNLLGSLNAKPVLVYLSILSSLFLTIAVHAGEERKEPQSITTANGTSPLSDKNLPLVKSGPFKTERNALLLKIQSAKEKGVGIGTYMMLFAELEKMVSQGSSAETISSRLNSIENGLSSQLSNQGLITTTLVRSKNASLEQKPEELLPLDKARTYVLSLVNADRARYHLPPLKLDSIASIAGQRHTDEMATKGFYSHWDTSGKKPWQRYNEAGGMHNDSENFAATYGSCRSRNLMFSAAELKHFEWLFMSEKPPDDGHRLQILRPEHNRVGIGLSTYADSSGQSRICFVQEFIDEYGQYEKIPNSILREKPFKVAGRLYPGLQIDSISIHWEPEPKPMTVQELANTGPYSLPDRIAFSLPDEKLAIGKVWAQHGCQHFSITITPPSDWKAGLYYILIWAEKTKDKEHKQILVSTRTTHLH